MIPGAVNIAEGAALLRVLANPARLRIALHLLGGERSVGQLEEDLALKQPNLSQHLAELRDAGLLLARRESRAVFYRVAPGQPRHLLVSLLHGLGGAAPAAAPPPPRPIRQPVAAASFAVVEAAR
ncbi:transcriptional regulator [Roseomonas sp. M0104]|uniref:Transcriptional regulator n=1 Tax=Teichococcus coralli TaxID=2545983 RepID=A0A845B6P5_9PROT|nr:metalloregulator ArsR/SmtB family transcription factor [Pseudoroseomonas coralli]MXP62118.1 transcriptional regulator [Pseudoroseomonas coralli]